VGSRRLASAAGIEENLETIGVARDIPDAVPGAAVDGGGLPQRAVERIGVGVAVLPGEELPEEIVG
jgi:hypothetical protein